MYFVNIHKSPTKWNVQMPVIKVCIVYRWCVSVKCFNIQSCPISWNLCGYWRDNNDTNLQRSFIIATEFDLLHCNEFFQYYTNSNVKTLMQFCDTNIFKYKTLYTLSVFGNYATSQAFPWLKLSIKGPNSWTAGQERGMRFLSRG